MEDEYPIVSLGAGQGGNPSQGKRITVGLALAYSSAHATAEATASANTCLGFGWTHSYNVFLYTYQAAMFRRDQHGRITKFTRVPLTSPVQYKPTAGYFEIMIRNADGTFTINYPDGSLQKFKTFAGCPYLFATPIYQMTEQRDRNGNTTTLTYDAAGRLWKIADPVGRSITFTYDAWNRIQTITDPLGRTTRLVHAMFGAQLVRIMDPDGKTVDYEYDGLFRTVKKVKKTGDTFLYTYAGGTIKAEYLNPDGTRKLLASVANPSNWQLNPGALASFMAEYVPSTVTKTDARGNVWRYSYDKNGYPVTNTAPGQPNPARFLYDATTLKRTASVDANGNATYYRNDARGNVIAMTNCAGQVTRHTYEPIFNQVTSVTDPNGFVTAYVHDAKGNRTKETDPLGYTREWTYDTRGNVLTEKDKNDNVTTQAYDAWGNLVQIVNSLGNLTTFAYDAVGNLTRHTDANGHTTTYAYDNLDRLVAETDPLGNLIRYAYDPEGRRTSMMDANGTTTFYAYDERDRLTRTTNALGYVTSVTYDTEGNKLAETDANGHITAYAYDAQNRLSYITNALGYVTSYTYDAVGNRISETDANGHTTTLAYDCLNRLVRRTDALGYLTQYEYDAGPGGGGCGCGSATQGTGLITKQTDANGKVTYFKYCPLGRLLFTIRKQTDTADAIDANDAVTSYTYDRNGNRLSTANRITDTDYQTNWFGYDALNRPIASTNGAGAVTLNSYDPVGNVSTVTAPNGNVTVNSYDAKDRLIQVDDLIGRVASTAYDAVGNPISAADGNGNTTYYAYDALNRPVTTTDAMGSTSTNYFDPVGNRIRVTDRMTNATLYSYDALNRQVAMTDALNHTTTSTYDGVGNLRFLTDANNHTTEFQYDAANRLVRKIYPDTPSDMLAYTYDGVGNLLTRTDQKSHTTLYRYTDLYFLAQRDYPADADDNFSYDLAGRMLTAEKGGWLDTFAYDGANRLTNTTQNGKMVVSVYANPTGQRFVTYPGGRAIVEQTDFRSRLVAIDDGASPRPIAEQTYDLGNRLVQRANRNGTVAAYGYNANGWITSLEHTHGVTRIAGFAYDYDREGNKNYEAKLHDTADSEAYQYDPAYQLTDYKVGALSGGGIPSPSLEKTYNLDPVGNWNSLTSTLVPGGTTVEVRTHNAANKLTVRNGVPFTYDANGNLTQDELYNYAYDEENRLCAVKRRSDAQVVGQYDYDALSRRVIKIANPAGTPTQTRFYYDDQRIIEEQDTLGVAQATYVYGNYIDEVLTMDHADQTYYCHANALWSVEAVSDSTASPVERYAYDAYGFVTVTDGTSTPVPLNAWGTPHSAIGNPNLFTGRQLDEDTGQYNYRARSYDCFKGRFMQRDPQAELTPDWALIGQDHNLYSYVGNRPTYTGDPSGRAAPIIIAGIIIGGLAIVTVTYCAIVDRNDCVKQCGVGCVKSAHHDHVTVSGISISTLKIASVSIPCGWTCECK